jgi:hypothetical protein
VLNPELCRLIGSSVGEQRTLVVVRHTNGYQIRRESSIPTATLAVARFQAAVMSATTDWIAAGELSDVHVAILTSSWSSADDMRMRESIDRFGFSDPWSGSGAVVLSYVLAAVSLKEFSSLPDALAHAWQVLNDQDEAALRDWPQRDRFSSWCRPMAET